MCKLLVVVDMQNDFIDGALGTKEAQAIVDNVVAKIKEYQNNTDECGVIYTMDTHIADYLNTQEGRNLPVAHWIENTNGWRLNDQIDEFAGQAYAVYRKPTFGSLKLATDLNWSWRDATEIEFVGLCTDICVLSNVVLVKAALPEAKIIVDAACCAGVTPESHDTALNAMKMIQVEVRNQGNEPWRKKEA